MATTEIRSTEKEWNARDAALLAASCGGAAGSGGSGAGASSAPVSTGGSAAASSPQSAVTGKTSSFVSGNGTANRSTRSPPPASAAAANTSEGVALLPIHDSSPRFLPPPHTSPGSTVSASPPPSAGASLTPLAATVAASSAPSGSPAGSGGSTAVSGAEHSSPSQSVGDAATSSAGNTVGGGTATGGRDSSVRAGGVGGKSKNSKGSRNRDSTSSTGSRGQAAKVWHIPIVACTASAMDSDAEICKNVGMDGQCSNARASADGIGLWSVARVRVSSYSLVGLSLVSSDADVLTKPVSINELKAKLRTVSLRWQLSRKTPPQSQASSLAPAQHPTTINSSVTAASALSGSGPQAVVSPLGAPITSSKQA